MPCIKGFISNRQRRKEGTFCASELAGIEPTPVHSRGAGYARLNLSATAGICYMPARHVSGKCLAYVLHMLYAMYMPGIYVICQIHARYIPGIYMACNICKAYARDIPDIYLAYKWYITYARHINVVQLAYVKHVPVVRRPGSYLRHMPCSTVMVLFGTSHVPGFT